MVKKELLIGLIALMLISVFLVSGCVPSETIKIGFISPMSGQAAVYGEYIQRAFQIGVDEWNANNDLQIEAIYEDGKCAPADAVTAANKLVSIDKVDYLMTFCTGETNAVIPIAEENKVILLTAGTTAPTIETGNYVFRNIGSVGTGLPDLTRLAYEYNEQIALISENTEYAISSKEGFKQKYLALGGTVELDESFEATTADFRTIISKLKDDNIESIFVVVQSFDNSGLLFKQMKELDYHPKIFATEGAISVKALEKYADEGYVEIVEDAIFVQPYFDRENSKAKHLLDIYKTKHDSTDGPIPESYLATHYDAVYLLGEATINVGADSTLVRQYFLNEIKDWDGAIGKFSFDEKGDAVVDTKVNTVEDGQIVEYQQ